MARDCSWSHGKVLLYSLENLSRWREFTNQIARPGLRTERRAVNLFPFLGVCRTSVMTFISHIVAGPECLDRLAAEVIAMVRAFETAALQPEVKFLP